MLQTSLLLMKSLNKTETPIFLLCPTTKGGGGCGGRDILFLVRIPSASASA